MPDWLEGRHALITGGGTGIGASAATHLNAAGAKVSVLGRRREPLEFVKGIVGGAAVQSDVTDRHQVAKAFDEARAAHGPIEMLIVNAGIGDSVPFAKMSRESWDRIIATNLTAAFECAQAALPDLLASQNGRLVFVASVASLRGVPYAAHYAASKHGLLGLMRSLAAEYAKTNLTVNAVCPGYVDTPMTDQSIARVSQITGRDEEQSRAAITNMNASGRLVDPRIRGSLRADGARLESAVTGTVIERIQARGRFSGPRLMLTGITGSTPGGGSIAGSGNVDFSGGAAGLDLNFEASRARLLDRDDIAALDRPQGQDRVRRNQGARLYHRLDLPALSFHERAWRSSAAAGNGRCIFTGLGLGDRA